MLRGRHKTPKNVENTVFVRFNPASPDIRRHHLEDLFSQIGPIKKSSVILQSETSAYGFVKYTTAEDAALASVRCNNQSLPGLSKIRVQVQTAQQPLQKRGTTTGGSSSSATGELDAKKTNRLIIRNLSFYAKERDIRQALESFGDVSEVHIPTVSQGQRTLSRGFGFVTFSSKSAALKCLNSKDKIIIKDRPVEVAYAQHKTAYEQQKKESGTKKKSENAEVAAQDYENESSGEGDDQSDDDSENDTSEEEDDSVRSMSLQSKDETDNEMEDETSKDRSDRNPGEHDRVAVSEQRCLFVRNLPFDATRHDLFELFKTFGHISAIYIVRDKISGASRGTAFVSFDNPEDARKVTERGITMPTTVSLVLNGRELLVDLAVDKDTAGTLSSGADRATSHKDRRNMYLLTEGRVDNDEASGKMAWDELPENDKSKRQSAWSDKNTKLKSPIFFINPFRLSIRNLSKQIDEAALKKLFVDATERGLRLVKTEDQIAHWKAGGTMTTKDILARMKDPSSIIPPFDRSNVKQHIPSVFIQRDFSGKEKAMSRGFGFVEFQHHAHALACLRELNNNLRYSSEFAAGGNSVTEANKKRKSSKDPLPVPRLIVEFTVENRVKAKQQADRRAEQAANKEQQRKAHKPQEKNKKEKCRGAKQRERKRTEGDRNESSKKDGDERKALVVPQHTSEQTDRPKKMKRPRKRVKIDQDDANFSKLVESYKKQAEAEIGTLENPGTKRSDRRWFD